MYPQEQDAKAALKDIANRSSNALQSTKQITSPRYKRALQLHKTNSEYLARIAEGKTRPFPDIAENWVTYQKATERLSGSYQEFLSTEDEAAKQKLGSYLLDSVQLVGVVLRNASHGDVPEVVLTEESIAEQEQLMQEFNTMASADEEDSVELLSPDVIYTLKHLPIPLQFAGPKDTEIMLHSEVGGNFPNNFDYIKIKTDENGLAKTFWISNGDGVANCQINYRSPALTGKESITAVVRELTLLPLESFSPLAKKAIEKIDQNAH